MKCLDVFSALGGWGDGFASEGFEVLGIEINPEIARLYKHDVIVADVKTLNGELFKGFDVIVGSPPCRDFSVTTSFGWKYWKDKPNIERGLELVNCFLRFVEDAKPEIWIMENVPRLEKFLGASPIMITRLSRTMKRAFWGDFPKVLIPCSNEGRLKADIQGKYRSWQRAKIPLSCSQAFAKACKEALEKGSVNG